MQISTVKIHIENATANLQNSKVEYFLICFVSLFLPIQRASYL
jgi:hypothetical protein